MGPQGEQGIPGKINSWTHIINNAEVSKIGEYNYEVTIFDERFQTGSWYDIWAIGYDGLEQKQMHIDTFTAGITIYGIVQIYDGYITFPYILDITGYSIQIFYGGIDE